MAWVEGALSYDVIISALKRIPALPNIDFCDDKSAKSLAEKLAATLDSYAAACLILVLDNRISYNENLPVEELQKSLPELGSLYLTDDGWRYMNRALVVNISLFINALSLADETVTKAWVIDAPSPAWAICSVHCANLGQLAATLAKNVREAYGRSDATTDWNRRDRLTIEMRRIEEEEAAWQARRVETERAQSKKLASR